MNVENVVVLFNQLGPYHVARLNAMGSLNEFRTFGVELCRNEAAREWTLPSTDLRFSIQTIHDGVYETTDPTLLARGVVETLERLNADALVIAGYATKPMRAAAEWAKRNGRLCVLMSESTWFDQPRNRLRERLKGWWVRRYFDAAFVGGGLSATYLQSLGVPFERIWRGYDVVNNSHFEALAAKARTEPEIWRERLDLPEWYFLYVGRFAPEKNLERLLRAYKNYRKDVAGEQSPWDLVMVGNGALAEHLKQVVAQERIGGVHWHGFKQIDELPFYYGLASCFVLPSTREPWGLVINEAMASGLPLLLSNRCGALGDLAFPGLNCYVFDPHDLEDLSRLMLRIASGQVNLKAMGEFSKKVISPYSPESWAGALADCITVSLKRKMRGN